nr:PREDICTED: uncharacterized protein LOC109033465 [Bemisia tabaci]
MSLKISVIDILPTRINGFPLKINQQILFYFLIPTLITLTLYILSVVFDTVVGVRLILEKKVALGVITLLIIAVPAVLDYIYQISYTRKIVGTKRQINWNVCHFIDTLLFPFHIVICLIQEIYLTIGAMSSEDPAREEKLQKLIRIKKEIQVYQFLHAFLHTLPQALLQLYLLLDKPTSKSAWTRFFQICSLSTSILITTSGVQMYHRYESQRVTISTTGSNPINSPDADNAHNNNQQDGENAERQEPQGEQPQDEHTTQDLLRNERLKRTFSDDPSPNRPLHYYQNNDDHIGRTVLYIAWLLFIIQRIFAIVPAFKYIPTFAIITFLAHYILITVLLTIRDDFFKRLHYILFLGYVHIFGVIEVGIKINRAVAYHFLFYGLVIVEDILLNYLWYNYGKWKSNILYQVFIMNYVFLIVGPLLMILYFKCLRNP